MSWEYRSTVIVGRLGGILRPREQSLQLFFFFSSSMGARRLAGVICEVSLFLGSNYTVDVFVWLFYLQQAPLLHQSPRLPDVSS